MDPCLGVTPSDSGSPEASQMPWQAREHCANTSSSISVSHIPRKEGSKGRKNKQREGQEKETNCVSHGFLSPHPTSSIKACWTPHLRGWQKMGARQDLAAQN